MTIQGGRIQFPEASPVQESRQKSGVKIYTGPAAILGLFARIAGKVDDCKIGSKQYCYNVKSMKQFIERNQIPTGNYVLNKQNLSGIVDIIIETFCETKKEQFISVIRAKMTENLYIGSYLTGGEKSFSGFKEQCLETLKECGIPLHLEESELGASLNETPLNIRKYTLGLESTITINKDPLKEICVKSLKTARNQGELLQKITSASQDEERYPKEIRDLLKDVLQEMNNKLIIGKHT